jgi:hypothetical protein
MADLASPYAVMEPAGRFIQDLDYILAGQSIMA